MKHVFFATALLIATAFSNATFAADKTNPIVQQAFQNNFSTAKDVEWTVSENLYKATFTFNGQVVTAFYSADGSQLALSRNIATHQLPVTLQAELKKNYKDYWVSDLFEMNDADGLSYYITVENGDSKVVLKSQSSYSWGLFQKTKKA